MKFKIITDLHNSDLYKFHVTAILYSKCNWYNVSRATLNIIFFKSRLLFKKFFNHTSCFGIYGHCQMLKLLWVGKLLGFHYVGVGAIFHALPSMH
jgi:hypothetical protein